MKGPYVDVVPSEYSAVTLTEVRAPFSEVIWMFPVPAEPSGMLMTGGDGEVRSKVVVEPSPVNESLEAKSLFT